MHFGSHVTDGFMITTGKDLNAPNGHYGSFSEVQEAHDHLLKEGWGRTTQHTFPT